MENLALVIFAFIVGMVVILIGGLRAGKGTNHPAPLDKPPTRLRTRTIRYKAICNKYAVRKSKYYGLQGFIDTEVVVQIGHIKIDSHGPNFTSYIHYDVPKNSRLIKECYVEELSV